MNNKIILIFVALLPVIAVKAQTQKGDQLLGGSIGLSTYKNNTSYTDNTYNINNVNKTNAFSIGATYSYFISNNLDLGVAFGYSNQKSNYNYATAIPDQTEQLLQSTFHALTASVYLRRYFLFNNKIGIRTGPFINFQKGQSDQNYNQPQSNYFSHDYDYSAGINADLVFFPVKRLGFAANIGSFSYSHDDDKQSNYHDVYNYFGFNLISNGLVLSAFYCFDK